MKESPCGTYVCKYLKVDKEVPLIGDERDILKAISSKYNLWFAKKADFMWSKYNYDTRKELMEKFSLSKLILLFVEGHVLLLDNNKVVDACPSYSENKHIEGVVCLQKN